MFFTLIRPVDWTAHCYIALLGAAMVVKQDDGLRVVPHVRLDAAVVDYARCRAPGDVVSEARVRIDLLIQNMEFRPISVYPMETIAEYTAVSKNIDDLNAERFEAYSGGDLFIPRPPSKEYKLLPGRALTIRMVVPVPVRLEGTALDNAIDAGNHYMRVGVGLLVTSAGELKPRWLDLKTGSPIPIAVSSNFNSQPCQKFPQVEVRK